MNGAVDIGFDDAGQPVPTVGFDFERIDGDGEAPAPEAHAGPRNLALVRVLLDTLALAVGQGRDALETGRVVLCATYLLRHHLGDAAPGSLEELGQRMGHMSRQAAWKRLTKFRAEIAALRTRG